MLVMIRIEEGDLEANQRGHLSHLQYKRLVRRSAQQGVEPPLADSKVERVTGLVSIIRSQASHREDFQLSFGDMPVTVEGCEAEADDLGRFFEPNRIYTAYCIPFAGHRLLLSIEEGPDWLGGMDSFQS